MHRIIRGQFPPLLHEIRNTTFNISERHELWFDARLTAWHVQDRQYDFAKTATSVAGSPLNKHGPPPPGWSKGMHRSVADVSSFICVSAASLPGHGRRPSACSCIHGTWLAVSA